MQKNNLFRNLAALLPVAMLSSSALAWQPVTNGLPNSPTISRLVANGNLAALNVSSGSPTGVYLSTNAGASWFKPATLPGSTQTATDLLVVGNTVYVVRTGQSVGTNIIMYSTNYGATWIGGTNLPNGTALHLIASDGANLFAGATASPWHVWRSGNGGSSWDLVGTSAGNFGFGSLRSLGGHGGQMVAAYNNGLYTLTGNGTNWTKITTDNNVISGTHMSWQQDRLFMLNGDLGRRSLALLDGGTNVFDATNGLPEGYFNVGTYRDLTASPEAVFLCAQLYTPAGYQANVFTTLDGGTNWNALSTPAGSTDVACVSVISNGLFATFNAAPGLYRVQLQNGQPLFAPAFTTNPASAYVVPGANVTFTAGVTSSVPMSLQWRKNGLGVPGETNLSISLSNVTTNDQGGFTLAAWNLGGTNISSVAMLGVIPPTPGHLNLDFNPGVFGYDYGVGTNANGSAFSVIALTNDQIVIAGTFSHVNMTADELGNVSGGFRSQKIARLNADGSADISFLAAPGFGLSDTVNLLALAPDNKIYVAGSFNSYNGVAATNLLRLNSDGSLDAAFNPVFRPANNFGGSFKRIQPLADGRVVVTGTFTNVSGTARTNIVCLNNDGTVDTAWFASGVANSTVQDLSLNADGELLVGGSFSGFDGIAARKYLVTVGTNGLVNTNFNHTLNSFVTDLETQPGGLLWVLGSFTQYTNGATYSAVKPVRLFPDGAVASISPTNLANPGKLLSQADGRLIVSFNNGTNRLARLNADGSLDNTFETMSGFNSSINDLALTPSGRLYVAGYFTTVAGVPVGSLVSLYAATTNVPVATPFGTLAPMDTVVPATSNAVLRAAAAGAAPLTFRWLQDGAPVADATNTALSFVNFSSLNVGAYQFVASNSFGVYTSAVANVTLAVAPSITQQPPTSTGATNGGTVAISVGVAGSQPLAYQWYQNNISSFGRTNNPLVITNFSSGLAGNWTLVATNLYGRTTSSIVNVQIGTVPSIFTQPNNQTLFGTGNVGMVVGASGTAPLSFQWYQNNSPVPGLNTNSFTITNAVPPNAGSYYLVVSNFVGSVTSLTRTVTIYNPYITAGPTSRAAPEGSNTNLSVLATGTAPIDYYWYQRKIGAFTNLISFGSTNLNFVNLNRTNGGQYFAVASNVWGAVTSSIASLTVEFKPAITNLYPGTNIVAEANSYANFFIQFEASPYPGIYWYKDGVYQPSLYGTSLSFYPALTNHSGSYQVVVSNYLGAVTSAPIVLTVSPPRPPTITNEPMARIVKLGDSFTLTAGVDGSPTLQYAVFRQGVGQVAAWASGYIPSVTVTATNQTGDYYFVVTNNYGSATSQLASVRVIQAQPATFNGKQFVKIADSLTTIPGVAPLKFGSFRDAFIRSNQVWFGGSVFGVPFSMGVYHWSNSVLARLVDTNSLVPGAASHFTNFYGSTFLSDGKVVFAGNGSGFESGLYAWTNGAVIKLYDNTTIMPGRSDTFERFGWPTVVGNQFAFLGFQSYSNANFDDDYRAVYISSNSVLTKLADTNSLLPHVGGNFRGSSSQVAFDGTNVSWWAWNSSDSNGIFRVSPTGVITNLADTLTVNPATSQNFDGFISPPTAFDGRTYLVGHDTSFKTTLLYHDLASPLTVIVKPGDVIPSRGMTFDSVGYPAQAASAAGVFFDGADGGGYNGIYFWDGTNSVKVIDSLDTLDGQTISYVYVADAEDCDAVFYVNFTSGKTALYAMMSAGPTFSQWATQYALPPGAANPQDDADGDGILNIFEYYFASNPTNAASGAQPGIVTVNVSGVDYPAITFIRSQNVSGVTLLPQVSSTLSFGNSLGFTVSAVVDLGNGTERVTIRSNVSMGAQVTQFLRIQLSVP